MRALILALSAAALAAPALAQPVVTEAGVRDLVARQAAALNAGDLSGYLATFAPAAVFTNQALGSDNRIVPYGRSTVGQARAQLGRTLGKSKVTEAVRVRKVFIAPGGRAAALSADVRTRIETGGGVRISCAQRLETVALVDGRLKALAQTDTLVRCRTGS